MNRAQAKAITFKVIQSPLLLAIEQLDAWYGRPNRNGRTYDTMSMQFNDVPNISLGQAVRMMQESQRLRPQRQMPRVIIPMSEMPYDEAESRLWLTLKERVKLKRLTGKL